MSGRLPYVKRKKYPHMIAEEAEVWGRFVDKFPERFDSVDYDFRVGDGQKYDKGMPEKYGRMITMLTQHRIDVLGWVGEKPTIIEVKERAVFSTIGQLIGYRALFIEGFKNLRDPDLLCVCREITDDDWFVFKSQNIPVEVV